MSDDTQDQFSARLHAVLQRCLADYQSLVSCERLSGGANQETYCIVFTDREGAQAQLAMRRAAGGSGKHQQVINVGLATEAHLFEVARAAGVPTPHVHYVFEPADELGDGFIMSWLDGETLGSRIVRSPQFADVRPQLAAQCGKILARIHAIDIHQNGLGERLVRTSPHDFVTDTWARYQALHTPQPMIDYTALWLLDNLPTNSRTTLVHNDFRNGNLMVDNSGIVGVLDWEVAHIGDPVRDLGWLCTNSWRFGVSEMPVGGFGDYDALLEAYAAESGVTVDPIHLRFWEVAGSFWWAVGCLSMAQQNRDGPDRNVERPAIGRRSSECQMDCVNFLIPGPVELIGPKLEPNSELPRIDELLDSVRSFLHTDVMRATSGRVKFLARVAANSLDIVARELALGREYSIWEQHSLRALLRCEGTVDALRWQLVEKLRSGAIGLHNPMLGTYLRNACVNQLAIDQPQYPGFKLATDPARSR